MLPFRILRQLQILLTASSGLLLVLAPSSAFAAANTYATAPSSVRVGDTVTVSIYVNTGGQSANTFQGTLSYPSFLTGVRGTYSGSICTLPITQPDPSGGSATYSCGTSGGYTGTGLVASVIFTANAAGSGSLGMSGCQVLANDGKGTAIPGGCTGTTITVVSDVAATPTPVAATPAPVAAVRSVATATPKPTLRPSSSSSDAPKPAELPSAPPVATPAPTPPPVQVLPSATPSIAATKTPEVKTNTQRRTISEALRDFVNSLHEISHSPNNYIGLGALLLIMVPLFLCVLAVMFFLYRVYGLERKRHRAQDRLFEMELSELAALEAKMELLAEKGPKGREEYREEFHKTKNSILRQIHPDYDRPVDPPGQISS